MKMMRFEKSLAGQQARIAMINLKQDSYEYAHKLMLNLDLYEIAAAFERA